MARPRRRWSRAVSVVVAVVAALGVVAAPAAGSTGRAAASAPAPAAAQAPDAGTLREGAVPVLAYYYIWYDPTTWDTKKSDLPKLGKYSSDDTRVMRQQVEWAKQAGIDGFIVSWKETPQLDRRLEKLVEVARAEDFKLAIIYQGLDYSRNPLPGGAPRVAQDLDWFTLHYGNDPVFHIFSKPLVIWSGTWEFSPTDIALVTAPRRSNLLILASERNVDGYSRLADSVDGNAYYWSSVNPRTYKGYVSKLVEMGRAAQAHGGLWIAPAAPGFDARKIGGSTVVPRDEGKTLDEEITAAFASKPDALGLISWNEFSESSYIEPSQNYGFTYLNAVGERLGDGPPVVDPSALAGSHTKSDTTDSSSPGKGFPLGVVVLPAFVLFFVVTLVVAARRGRPRGGHDGGSGGDQGGGEGGGGSPHGGHRPPPPEGSRRARREARRRFPAGITGFRIGTRPAPPRPPAGPTDPRREPVPAGAPTAPRSSEDEPAPASVARQP